MPHTDDIEQQWVYRGKGFDSASELRALRKAAGWSQDELAQRVGVHVCTVKYHEAAEGRVVGVAPRRFRETFDREGVVLRNEPPEAGHSCPQALWRANSIGSAMQGQDDAGSMSLQTAWRHVHRAKVSRWKGSDRAGTESPMGAFSGLRGYYREVGL